MVESASLLLEVPVQNLEAERWVLGTCLMDPHALDLAAEVLTTDDFYKQAHATIYGTILSLREDQFPVECKSVALRLKERRLLDAIGGVVELDSLSNTTCGIGSVEYYAGKVLEAARKRRTIHALNVAREDIRNSTDPTEDVLSRTEQNVLAATKIGRASSEVTLPDLLGKMLDRLDRERKGENPGIKLGFADLDDKVKLHGGDLSIVAARPGVGKTTLAINIARNLTAGRFGSRQYKTVMVTLEDTAIQVARKLITNVSRQWCHERMTEEERFRFGQAAQEVAKWPLSIEERTCGHTVSRLRSEARRLKSEGKLDVLLVDYLQYLSTGRDTSRSNRQEEVAEVSRGLKAIATELDVPVVACAQLNRESENRPGRKPRLSDLRESGGIEADASVVLLLSNPSEGMEPEVARERNIANQCVIQVAKNRHGPTGELSLYFDRAHSYFGDLDGERAQASKSPPQVSRPRYSGEQA